MSIFDRLKTEAIGARVAEEELYASVLREIESGVRRDGLWAKALASASGDEGKAKGLYIEYRVQSLRDEIEIAKRLPDIQAEATRQRAAAERQRIIDECSKALSQLGYRLVQKANGWEIREPLGGRARIGSLAELTDYTRSKEIQGSPK